MIRLLASSSTTVPPSFTFTSGAGHVRSKYNEARLPVAVMGGASARASNSGTRPSSFRSGAIAAAAAVAGVLDGLGPADAADAYARADALAPLDTRALADWAEAHVRLHLESLDIESRPLWKPMHLQPVFAGAECFGGAVSEHLFAHGLCLASGITLSDGDVERDVEPEQPMGNTLECVAECL